MRSIKFEDRKDIRDSVEFNGRSYCIAAVYDGHGGAQAADFCTAHMIGYMEEAARDTPSKGSQIRDVVAACKVRRL